MADAGPFDMGHNHGSDDTEASGLQITYQLPTGTRSEALDQEVLEALYRTGCRNICYAPESGSVRTLTRIKKKIKPARMVGSMRAANRAGIVVKANLMIGFPEETRREMWETVRFGMRHANTSQRTLIRWTMWRRAYGNPQRTPS